MLLFPFSQEETKPSGALAQGPQVGSTVGLGCEGRTLCSGPTAHPPARESRPGYQLPRGTVRPCLLCPGPCQPSSGFLFSSRGNPGWSVHH